MSRMGEMVVSTAVGIIGESLDEVGSSEVSFGNSCNKEHFDVALVAGLFSLDNGDKLSWMGWS